MSTDEPDAIPTWIQGACTLPTAERPLRTAEFARFAARSLRGLTRQEPTTLRLELEPNAEVAANAADLALRESECCSFFTFALVASGGELRMDVSVPEAHTAVLDALAWQAT